MKFKVFGDEQKDPEVFFRLEQRDYGIVLMAVNSSGERLEQGNILIISKEGMVRLCASVNEEIGLQLDDDGRVLLEQS